MKKKGNYCKNCKYFEEQDDKIKGFVVGHCEIEPFDNRDLKNNHTMSVDCGHDGGITVGEMFGCVNHTEEMK